MQVISLLDAHFAKAGLPVYLRPYTVIPNRSGLGNNIGAILEVIPNVRQFHVLLPCHLHATYNQAIWSKVP
jgi:hypothetical protein